MSAYDEYALRREAAMLSRQLADRLVAERVHAQAPGGGIRVTLRLDGGLEEVGMDREMLRAQGAERVGELLTEAIRAAEEQIEPRTRALIAGCTLLDQSIGQLGSSGEDAVSAPGGFTVLIDALVASSKKFADEATELATQQSAANGRNLSREIFSDPGHALAEAYRQAQQHVTDQVADLQARVKDTAEGLKTAADLYRLDDQTAADIVSNSVFRER